MAESDQTERAGSDPARRVSETDSDIPTPGAGLEPTLAPSAVTWGLLDAVHSPHDGHARTTDEGGAGPAPGGVADLEEFSLAIVEIGLIDADELAASAADSAEGVLGLSRALVKAGKLTTYQAAAVYQKKSRGLLIGNYLVLEKLGQGGMGVVFKARHRQSGRVGALKILPPSFARDKNAVTRFRREVEAAGRLQHPNLVAAQDADEDRGVHFMVMDYVAGRDLDRVVRERGPMPVVQAIDGLIQAARGLEAAHAEGIIHRDIKPSNLMLDDAGIVRVLDLGLARIADAANPFSTAAEGRLTQSGQFMGTVNFMAPEQAEDSHRADHRADIYSLGCTFYYLVTGREPFPGETIWKRLKAHVEQPAPSLCSARPTAPASLDAVYQKMMAKRPDDRPASMAEVAALLEACKADAEAMKAIGESPKSRPELMVFNEVPLRSSDPPRALRDPSKSALRDRPGDISTERDLDLEDLEMEVRSEIRPMPLHGRRWRSRWHGPWLSGVERVATWARRKPTLAAAYALGLLALVFGGLGGAAVWQWRAAARARDVEATARAAAERARDVEATARAAAERARDVEATVRAAAEKARDVEATARAAAERARDVEATAEKARDEVAKGREELARAEYGLTMEVAHQRWRENDVPAALALLERTRPDLRGWEWRYVDRLCHSDLLTLKGHTGGVLSASFSPDGSRIVTTSYDNTAKIWDAKTGVELLTLEGHDGGIHSASFSPDGSRIVTGSGDRRTGKGDNTAKVWDAKTGAELFTLKGHVGLVFSAFSPDGLRIVTASDDRSAKVWDARTGREFFTLKGHTDSVSWASFSPDGMRVVTVSKDKTARIWDARTGRALLTLKGHTDQVSSAWFSPDGSRVVTASDDRSAKVWDATTGTEVLTLKGHTDRVSSATFSPDGSRVLTSASRDNTAKVWDARTGAEVLRLEGHTDQISSALFSPDGTRIATASRDRSAKLWDARTGALILTLKGHTAPLLSASFNPDGSRVVTAAGGVNGASRNSDMTAKVWDANTTGAEVFTVRAHTGDVLSASFNPEGSRVVTTDGDTAKVWNAKSGTEIVAIKGHAGSVRRASFSPDGSRIITVCGDTVVDSANQDRLARLWDASTGAEVLTLKGHTAIVSSAAFSPDGSRIVTGSHDRTAKVWNAKTGAEVLTLKGHTAIVSSASFSPDGSRIATGSHDRTVKVWDARSGAVILTIKGHTDPIVSAAFSPDGSRIVTGSLDSTAKIWDARTGAEVRTLAGHTEAVVWARFGPDGTRIITASMDNSAKVWDAGTGVEVFALKGDTAADPSMSLGPNVWSASFSPDGSRIVTANANGTAKIWDARPINRQVVVANRFLAVIRGEEQPADNAERLALAQMACEGKNFFAAARLWARAMEADPKLGDDRRKPHRYNAARAACLAAAGQGQDEPPPDDAAKAKLRGQALDWLRAELKVWTDLLESGPPQARPAIVRTLGQWLRDPDLAGIRDAAALARLPAGEGKAFAQLWAGVVDVVVDVRPFVKRVSALPAAEQVEQVRKELKKRNPGYDGTLTPTIEGGAVIGLEIPTDHVTDISPVRALTRLRRLGISGSRYPDKGALADLTPLDGMSLTHLVIDGNPKVEDLSALKGMPLKYLEFSGARVKDLAPLEGMPMEWLSMWSGFWGSDLMPLKGMPLKHLNCGGGGQKLDLAPLAGMPLECLHVDHTKVSDLAPIRRLPLNELNIWDTSVADLSSLKDLPLKKFSGDFRAPRDTRILRAIKTLETINDAPAARFWETPTPF